MICSCCDLDATNFDQNKIYIPSALRVRRPESLAPSFNLLRASSVAFWLAMAFESFSDKDSSTAVLAEASSWVAVVRSGKVGRRKYGTICLHWLDGGNFSALGLREEWVSFGGIRDRIFGMGDLEQGRGASKRISAAGLVTMKTGVKYRSDENQR